MLGTLIVGYCALYALNEMGKRRDTKVKHGRDLFGHKYKTEDGVCFRCDGSGKVHGSTCRQCGGDGRYHRRTWYS